MRTVLITGGAGFIGSTLALGIKTANPTCRVIALDNLRRRGSELNLRRLHGGGVEFIHGDIRNAEDFAPVPDCECLIECSAEPSVLAGYNDSPAYVINANLHGTVNCLDWARRQGSSVIFLSTSRVYPVQLLNSLKLDETDTRFVLNGKQEFFGVSEAGISETFPLDGPRSIYGATKLCSELLLAEYGQAYGMKSIVNRCGLVAGPWQMGRADQGVVVHWAARHLFGGTITYIGYGGKGKQVRDVLHVLDLVDLVLYELDHLEQLNGRTVNVGGGRSKSFSLMELTEICREVTGKAIEVDSSPQNRPADVPLYISDNGLVRHITGWLPTRGVRQVVEDIVKWIRDNQKELDPILG